MNDLRPGIYLFHAVFNAEGCVPGVVFSQLSLSAVCVLDPAFQIPRRMLCHA